MLRGQKLPIFSGAGMPHDQIAAQIVRQATLGTAAGEKPPETDQFAIVFAAMGVKHDVADFFRQSFSESGALTRVAMFLNLADDPPVERLVTPRAALTLAEYLAYERGMHVLVILTDMTNYCEALAPDLQRARRGSEPQGLSRLSLQRPGLHVRAHRPHPHQ